MDLKTKKRLFNAFEPLEPLSPEDKKNFDIDDFEVDGKKALVRGVSWIDTLSSAIELSDKPIYELFSGYTGSGKTTELKRAIKRLEDKNGANLFCVYIDATDFFDLHNEINIADVYLVILHKITEKMELEADDGYAKRFYNWLKDTEVSLDRIDAKLTPINLIFKLKENKTLQSRVRELIGDNFHSFKQEIHKEFERLNDLIKEDGYDGTLVVLDSLERLSGTSEVKTEDIIKSVDNVFRVNKEHLLLPVHTIYTIPPIMTTMIKGIKFLPVIKVIDKERNSYPNGIKALQELIYNRMNRDECKNVFGADYDNVLQEIILYTGGYPRDLIKIIKEILLEKEFPVSDKVIEKKFSALKNEYKDLITLNDCEWLEEVGKIKNYIPIDDGHSKTAQKMFELHTILKYKNDDDWYDLHPAMIKVLEDIKELKIQDDA